MPEQTSIDAYRVAISTGRISKARAVVLECACNLPTNFSQADVCGVLGTKPTDFRRFAPRVRELEMMGVLKATGTKADPSSGMPVKTYKVTGLPPLPIPGRMSSKTLRTRMLDFLLAGHTDTEEAAKLVEQLRQSLKLTTEEVAHA